VGNEAIKPEADQEISRLLDRWGDGDYEAAAEVFPLVYDELHKIARAIFGRERKDHTLQTTAIIHEAYLKVSKGRPIRWESRLHFFRAMARVMRRVLVDHARGHECAKRGGGRVKVGLEILDDFQSGPSQELFALDEALTKFSSIDPEGAEVVELRFFGGYSIEETAELVGVSPSTVVRQWRAARAWLFHELSKDFDLGS
jgi:RNA polymerase sigma factor (TIGR02999 family)